MKKQESLKSKLLAALDGQMALKISLIAKKLRMDASHPATRRALQRALKSLSERGLVVLSGNARSRVYELASKLTAPQRKNDDSTLLNDIALDSSSKNLLNYVSQPVTKRVPVGYNQSFLKNYRPNKTFYLDKSQRELLRKLGTVIAMNKPAGTYARDIFNRLLIDLSWNSSRLEGNTYSFLETRRLIEFGEAAEGKEASEAQMILNHKAAIEFLIDSAKDIGFDKLSICNIHALLSDNLLGDPSASGKLRERPVSISGSTYMPLDNPYSLKEYFLLFLDKINLIEDPFEKSFFSLVHLSYMQAFEDVNKRTSRLVANISLIKENLIPLAFVDVDQDIYLKALLGIYEKNDVSLFRDLFLWAYKRSTQRYSAIQQSLGEPNLIKLKYRTQIHEIIKKIVLSKVSRKLLTPTILKSIKVLKLPLSDAKKLFDLIETEFDSLHEGNIARYQIKLSEFKAWSAKK